MDQHLGNMASSEEEHPEQSRIRFEDPHHEEYKRVSSVTLPVETIPQNLQNVARKILGKHSPKEVR
jgi:hypothetical protein